MYKCAAIELREKFTSGEFSAEEIVTYFLDRIDRFDSKIRSFLLVNKELVLEKSRELDKKKKQGKSLGKLAGIPIGIKDNIHVKGLKTTCASKMLKNYIAPMNATVIDYIEAEDGIVLGKLNMDEFAMGSTTLYSSFHPTYNPWNLECVPGGSSGGSAAAVAARLCPLSLGSDTGGSIRQPAAFCGVVGLKPSYGRVSRQGLVAFASSLDQIGPFATNVKDIGLIMEVLGSHDPKDATSYKGKPENYLSVFSEEMSSKVIGVPKIFLEDLNSDVKNNFIQALEVYERLGWKVKEIDLNLLQHAVAMYYVICTAEAATNLARYDGIRFGYRSSEARTLEEVYTKSREEALGKEVKRRILVGNYVLSSANKSSYYTKASQIRSALIESFENAFLSCDFIATPVTATSALKIGEILDEISLYLQDIFTVGVNLAYLPGIAIPSGFSKKTGMPLSIQLIAPRKQDRLLCQAAYVYEQATDWKSLIPEDFDVI